MLSHIRAVPESGGAYVFVVVVNVSKRAEDNFCLIIKLLEKKYVSCFQDVREQFQINVKKEQCI